ncbi:MAG: hypothetical protein GX103_13295 [Bacteroidales bacterium]|nr:hypothetical protein [Bacteroidales bacterium]
MAKDSYIHIRVSSDLKQAAKQHAADTGRTLAGLIEWLLRQELKKNVAAAGRLIPAERRFKIMNSKIEMVKEYIQDEIQERGFENNQIEIDFAGICEESETIQAAKELDYLATPGEGQGVWWIYVEQ